MEVSRHIEDDFEKLFKEFWQQKALYFFGAGAIGKRMIHKYQKQFDIQGVFDNDKKLQGTEVNQVPILSPATISQLDLKNTIIVVTCNVQEIFGQLKRSGALYVVHYENMVNYVADDIVLWKKMRQYGYLYDQGWFRSVKQCQSIDLQGQGIPWISYPCLDFLKDRVHTDMAVFEWGCGGSTEWWSNKVRSIVSVEHDKKWYDDVFKDQNVNGGCYIELEYGGAYCQKILEFTKCFDIIMIDGRDRVNCAKNCLGALKNDGVVLWDNTDRTEYQEGYDYLISQGFKRIDFWGNGPMNLEIFSTSIFYKNQNCLQI